MALFCIGLYAVLSRRNLIKIVMGLSLMESSTYLLLISLAYRANSTAPVLLSPPPGTRARVRLAHGNVADPVLQNFCLTAIVIGVAVTAVFLSVAVRISQHYRTLDADQRPGAARMSDATLASLLPLPVAIAPIGGASSRRSLARLSPARCRSSISVVALDRRLRRCCCS